MVHLDRIYTRSGDKGTTSLGNGQRVFKTDDRVQAMGAVDELNSILGVVLATATPLSFVRPKWIQEIQNDLFDLGADLCVPEKTKDQPKSDDPEFQPLRIQASQVQLLENKIDEVNENLSPLKSFILPGGTLVASYLHQARTICRRAEIATISLNSQTPINDQILIYLNRLSDLLFVLAREANTNAEGDVLWKPGANTV